ncbi:MAG: hypothetical protein MJ168_05420 [Clostridia bacterium]|nr:hypothetical protein [Clostridia bacterium]
MAEETKKFVGVFSTSEVKVEIKTDANYAEIADFETAKLSIDTNVETWYSIKDDGWQNALATAKAFSMSMEGKRSIGDPGNDYIAGLAFKNGRDLNTSVKLTFPDNSTFEGNVVCAVNNFGVDSATTVGPLAAALTGRGKPKFTPAIGTASEGSEEIPAEQ